MPTKFSDINPYNDFQPVNFQEVRYEPISNILPSTSSYTDINVTIPDEVPYTLQSLPESNPINTPKYFDNNNNNNRYSNIDTNTSTGVDITSFAPKLYEIETRGGTVKDRPGSNYVGIGQLGKVERSPYLKELGITDEQYRKDVNIQKQVTEKHLQGLVNRLQKSGFPVNELNLWVAHNQGVGGLNQILHNKVSPTVLKNIRNQAGMNKNSTPEDYLAYYSKRLANGGR